MPRQALTFSNERVIVSKPSSLPNNPRFRGKLTAVGNSALGGNADNVGVVGESPAGGGTTVVGLDLDAEVGLERDGRLDGRVGRDGEDVGLGPGRGGRDGGEPTVKVPEAALGRGHVVAAGEVAEAGAGPGLGAEVGVAERDARAALLLGGRQRDAEPEEAADAVLARHRGGGVQVGERDRHSESVVAHHPAGAKAAGESIELGVPVEHGLLGESHSGEENAGDGELHCE